MNKQVNQDLKNLRNLLNTNKVCLNISKTEVVLCKIIKKTYRCPFIKLKLNGKTLKRTNSLKYLGIKIDENVSWKQAISDIAIKLNRENAILSKFRHSIDRKI